MKRLLVVILASQIFLGQVMPTLAAESDAFQFFQEEAKVVTATLKATKSADVPATVYVISKEDIRMRGYVNLKDVLRDLPGMETTENYFSEQGTVVPVRGVVGNNKIIVLVNGMRVNPPGGEEMMFRSDFSVRQAERIEVVYGAGSTLYGKDAMSAVINVITATPKDIRHASVEMSMGTQQSKQGEISFSKKLNSNLGLTSYAHVTDSGLSDLSQSYPDWWHNYAVVAQRIGTGTTPSRWDKGLNGFLRLEGEFNSFQFWHRESSRSSAEGAYTPILSYLREAVWHDRSTVMEVKNKYPISDPLRLESSLTYNRYEIDPETRYTFTANNTSWLLNQYKYGVGKGISVDEKLFAEVNDTLSIVSGMTATDNDIVPKATIAGGASTNRDVVSQGGNASYYTRLGDASSLVTVPSASNLKYQSYGVFMEGHWQVTDPLQLIAGGRVDFDSRYSGAPFSPRASAIYRLSEKWTTKYIYTQAFVSPPPYDGYNVFDNGVDFNTSNPNLKPETERSHEINLSYDSTSVNASASAYWNDQSSLLVVGDRALPINVVQPVVYMDLAGTQTRILTQSVNSGKSESKGFDLSGRYRQGKLSGWGSYSYVDFQSDVVGDIAGLQQISRHNVRLGLTYAAWTGLFITPSMVFRSTPENLGNTFNLRNETRNPYEVNVHVLYEASRHWDVFADLRNVTNHHYALKGVLGPMPQEPFHLAMGAEYHF